MDGNKAYIRSDWEDEWVEIGTTTVDFEPKYSPQDSIKMLRSQNVPETVTINWSLDKLSTLEVRAFKRMFGLPVTPLIHNGKKRRK